MAGATPTWGCVYGNGGAAAAASWGWGLGGVVAGGVFWRVIFNPWRSGWNSCTILLLTACSQGVGSHLHDPHPLDRPQGGVELGDEEVEAREEVEDGVVGCLA